MLHTGVSLARRAAEIKEMRNFDAEERRESEGLRPEEKRRNERLFP